jgi:putative transposase
MFICFRVIDIELRGKFKQLEKKKRNNILKNLKSIKGVTIRQLSRVTGISKSLINRI